MPRPELTARNDRIVHYCTVYGFPATHVAAWYGITQTRVLQILRRRGIRLRRASKADTPRAAGAAPNENGE